MSIAQPAAALLDLTCGDVVHNVLDMGLPAYVPATMTSDMILRKIVFDKHFVKLPSMGLTSSIGEMAYDSDKGSFAFAIETDELVAALEANVARADYVCAPCPP